MRRHLLAVLLAVGCATSQPKQIIVRSNYPVRLNICLQSLLSAEKLFTTWDKEHQARLLWASPSIKEGEKLVAKYREDKRKHVVTSFSKAFHSLAWAAASPSDATMMVLTDSVRDVYEQMVTLIWDIE